MKVSASLRKIFEVIFGIIDDFNSTSDYLVKNYLVSKDNGKLSIQVRDLNHRYPTGKVPYEFLSRSDTDPIEKSLKSYLESSIKARLNIVANVSVDCVLR